MENMSRITHTAIRVQILRVLRIFCPSDSFSSLRALVLISTRRSLVFRRKGEIAKSLRFRVSEFNHLSPTLDEVSCNLWRKMKCTEEMYRIFEVERLLQFHCECSCIYAKCRIVSNTIKRRVGHRWLTVQNRRNWISWYQKLKFWSCVGEWKYTALYRKYTKYSKNIWNGNSYITTKLIFLN